MTDINIKLLSKEQLENNLIIVSVGNENYLPTKEDIGNITNGINIAVDKMKLDFLPSILIFPYSVNIEGSVKIKELKDKNNTKFTRFEIMDI